MAEGQYKLIKENATGTLDEKTVQAESGKVLGFNESLNPVMVPASDGGTVATGAELNTGTDDEKFASAKALKDSDYQRIIVSETEPQDTSVIWLQDWSEVLPEDDSITYSKLAPDLKGDESLGGTTIDWSSAGIFPRTITDNTIFTFTNLQKNKVITILLTGNFTVTWPSYMDADHLISGEYDGTANNYIQVHCTNAGSGTEEVWWAIKTEGA